MANGKPGLSDEKKQRLREMVESGSYSYTEIAASLGISRNSAIGYGHRMGLSTPNIRTTGQPKKTGGISGRAMRVHAIDGIRQASKNADRVNRMFDESVRERLETNWKSWADRGHSSPFAVCWDCLEPTSCRWPVRDAPFQFCGALRLCDTNGKPTSSYCAMHAQLSLRKHEHKEPFPGETGDVRQRAFLHEYLRKKRYKRQAEENKS